MVASVLVCFWVWLGASVFGGKVENIGQYRVQQWTTDDGLPQNSVQAILQTRDGYLWLGTRAGLARFDGIRFEVFNRLNTPAMVEDTCVTLLEDVDGTLWIGTRGGLLRYRAGQFKRYTMADGLCHDLIWSLSLSGSGGLWIASEGGLARFKDGQFTCFTPHTGVPGDYQYEDFNYTGKVHLVHEDAAGRVWIENSNNLEQFDPISGKSLRVLSRDHFSSLTSDRQGRLWWAGHKGLFSWDGENLTNLSNTNSIGERHVDAICFSDSEDAWVSTRFGGLAKLSAGGFTSIPLSLPAEAWVMSIYEDREGNVWIGTEWDGLLQLQTNRVRTFSTAEGLDFNSVQSIHGAPDGTVWVASSRGLNSYRDGKFTAYSAARNNFYNFESARCLFVDSDGRIWGGTGGHIWGVGIFLDARFYQVLQTPLGQNVRVIHRDSRGGLWVGTDGSLYHLSAEECEPFTNARSPSEIRSMPNHGPFVDEVGRSPENVRVVLEDRSGVLWFGTHGSGLWFLRDARFSVLRTSDGLQSDFVHALHEEPDGSLWVGTASGINRVDSGGVAAVTIDHGLPHGMIKHILSDDANHFWISSNGGIFRVNKDELIDVVEGRSDRVAALVLGEADGMLSGDTSSGYQPSGWKGEDGRLWFPTTKGVAVVDPTKVREHRHAPLVVIEQVVADGEVIFGDGRANRSSGAEDLAGQTSSPPLRLEPGRARVLQLNYTANTFVHPQKVRFRYKLQGYDTGWRESGGALRVAFYTNLRPGSYRFLVTACNSDGRWAETPAEFGFSLAPHFYQTWVFRISSLAAVVALTVGVHQKRVRHSRRLQLLEGQLALEEERERIARDMHDDLAANLTNVALLSELLNKDSSDPGVRERAQKISGIAGAVVDNISELVWATNPKYDTLDNLVAYLREYAGNWLMATSLTFNLCFPDVLPPRRVRAEVRRNLLLVLKEALRNVSKHSKATAVEVRLAVVPEASRDISDAPSVDLELVIDDNGIGMSGNSSPFSNGLLNMKARMEKIGGSFGMQSKLGEGTTVRVAVRLA